MDAELGQLDELVERLRGIDRAGVEIAEAAKVEILEIARETAAAGTTPDGASWAPRKADGGRALEKAASAISAVVSGTTRAILTLVLSGPYVFHHGAKGKRQRRILFDPAQGVPDRMRAAIERAAAKVIARRVGGGS